MGKLEKVIVLSVLAVIAVILVISLTLDDPLKKDKVVMAGNSPGKPAALELPGKQPNAGAADKGNAVAPIGAPNAIPVAAQQNSEPAMQTQIKPTDASKLAVANTAGATDKPSGAAPSALLSTTIAQPKQEITPPAPQSNVPAGSLLKTTDGLQDSYLADMKFYTWQNGDTFRSIAVKFYGDPTKFTLLRRSNEGRENVQAGEKILVPVFDMDAPHGAAMDAPHGAAPTAAAALPSAASPAGGKSAAQGKDTSAKSTAVKVADTSGGPRVHTVLDGESLWKIAKLELGDGGRWNEIYEANRDVLSKPESVHAGLKLRIPVK